MEGLAWEAVVQLDCLLLLVEKVLMVVLEATTVAVVVLVLVALEVVDVAVSVTIELL